MNHKTRRNSRFPFIAVAEIVHTESAGKFSCRVSELSLHGCYVDMLNTLPVGSEVAIKNLHTLGVDDKTIQAILRHSNVGLTMNVYVKSVNESQVSAMDALSEKLETCNDLAMNQTGRLN
jgi:hypothetical protein